MRVTRNDVAREAGVSSATVSYILNKSRNFSEETKQKVYDAVEKLGYKPDMIARSMVMNETHQLAIVMDSLLNPYYGEIALAFENAAVKQGYFINICSGQNNLDDYFDSFTSRRIDGLLILALPDKFHSEKLYDLVDSGIKIISGGIDNINLKKISLLDNNYGDGMKLAYDHLYKYGHRDIVYLSALTGLEQHDTRTKAFIECESTYNISKDQENIITSDMPYCTGIEDGYRLGEKLLKSGKKFTAIICTNDLMAMGAIQVLRDSGLRVPQDVSVIGFDNIIYSKSWSPSITSVTHDKNDFGKKAFEILRNNIQSNITGFYRADVSLFIGQSTGPVKKKG